MKIKITKESALEHLEKLYEIDGISKTRSGKFALYYDSGWTSVSPDEAAKNLSSDLENVDLIRSKICELGDVDARLPVPEIVLENYTIFFDTETELGEPQAWIYLKDKSSLELTHEENGLGIESQYFSLRHHCSEEDFENDTYHSTMGIIEECSGGLTDIAPMLERVVGDIGIDEEERLCPECDFEFEQVIRDSDGGYTTRICGQCGLSITTYDSGAILMENDGYSAYVGKTREENEVRVVLDMSFDGRDVDYLAYETRLDHPVTPDDLRRIAQSSYFVASRIYENHNLPAITAEAKALLAEEIGEVSE